MEALTESNSQLYIISSFASIGGFICGYHTGVISSVFTMTNFINKFGNAESIQQGKLTSKISGAIVGSLMFGCILGALLAGKTSDWLSRKYSIVVFSMVFFISTLLQAVSSSLPMLLITRVFSGMAVGAFSVIVPVYLSEIATKECRGRIVSLQQLGITIGIGVSFWIDYGMHGHNPDSGWAWRIPFALQTVPALILGVGIFFCPFSPRWLMSKARESDALNVLTKIRSGAPSDIQTELEGIKRELVLESEQEIQSHFSFRNTSLLRRLILGIGIQIFQQFSGINFIIYYTPEIFKQIGLSEETAFSLSTEITGCINIVFTIPTVLFIDKLGRRLIFIAGAIVMALSMLIAGGVMGSYGHREFNTTTHQATIIISNEAASYAIIISVYVFVAGFAFSWGPVMWVYCTELCPLSMRAKGTSIMLATNWTANFILSFVMPLLLESIWFQTYIIFGVLCVIIGILTFLFYPETKGIPLEKINRLFRGPIFTFSSLNTEQTGIHDLDYADIDD